jgi:hypothetical protein
MRSDSVPGAELDVSAEPGVVHRLLDPAFGFFVWAGHLVVLYVANAVFCVLESTSGHPRAQSALVSTLAAVTIVTAAVVVIHGVRRHREQPETPNHEFLLKIAVGQDAIAVLAILWQLIPIFMSPVCR